MTELETRTFEARVDVETRTVQGIAVPYNTATTINTRSGSYTETIMKGAVKAADPVVILRNHEGGPIGKVIEHNDADDGWNIRAQFLDTPAGNEAYELAKSGIAKSFSIGFLPVKHTQDKNGNITRSEIDVREVSLIVYPKSPAYAAAAIKEVREGEQMTEITKIDLEEVRDSVDALKREFAQFTVVEREPAVDTRSVGAIVKAIANEDENATREYNNLQRAYTGGTTADSLVKPAWVGDLSRVIDKAAPLTNVFSKGTLPETGMSIEYAQIKSNTISVTEQVNEGDNLAFGKVQVETKSAPVKTFGGYTELTVQEIKRSNVNILDTHFEAMAVATGQAINNFVAADYKALVAAQSANKVNVSTAAGYKGWLGGIVDAAGKLEDAGLSIDALVVDTVTFKDLMGLQGSDGRPVMLVTGSGINNVGTINVKGLTGDLANVTVVASRQLVAADSAFVDSRAIKLYRSPVVRLQDSNIVNLSQQFSIYTLAAVANEFPGGVVPVAKVA